MKWMVIIVVSLFACDVFAQESETTTVSASDIQEVVNLIHSDTTHGFLDRDSFSETGGIRIVFRFEGQRYTMYFSGNGLDTPFLSVWIRPDGTHDRSLLQTFSDFGLDGSVEHGSCGEDEESPEVAKRFDAERGEGLNYRDFYQELYAQAIRAALHTLRN